MQHIVKPLLRHRMMPLLVLVQVALACAIACNALFLLQQKLVPITATDGIDEPARLIVATNLAAHGKPWQQSRLLEAEQVLRAIPGVTAVSIAGSLPMQGNVQMNGNVIGSHGSKANATVYIGNHLPEALGVTLIAGRGFSADEQAVLYKDVGVNESGPTIITQALAEHLFPDGKALGQVIRIGDAADAGRRTVVGVIEHLIRNDLGQDNRADIDYSMLFPGVPGNWPMPSFAVRVARVTDAERVRKAMRVAIQRELGNEMVKGIDPSYVMYSRLRDQMLARSKAAVWLLAGVSVIVLLVTLVGIFGLTGYWVQQRTRQIGTRRALGARRAHILRELRVENLLVVGTGIVLGLGLAYAINLWLMQRYELPRLPWIYLPYGALLMLCLGQLAVWVPAHRAAAVPPVVATRSV